VQNIKTRGGSRGQGPSAKANGPTTSTTALSQTSTTSTTSSRKPMRITQVERLEWVIGESAKTSPESGDVFPILPVPIDPEMTYTSFEGISTPPVYSSTQSRAGSFYRPASWTAQLMSLFNCIKIINAVVEWVPRCGASDRGNIIISHLKDVTDITGATGFITPNLFDWASSRWNLSTLESTGSRSISFPVWKSSRFALPLSGHTDFYSPKLDLGTYSEEGQTLAISTGARSAFSNGVWMVGVEGLSQVASSGTSYKLSDFGHFRISYTYELSEPISVGATTSIPNSKSLASTVKVDSLSSNVLDTVHTINLERLDDLKYNSISVNRESINPLFSPFKRITQVSNDIPVVRVPLDIMKSGSDLGILLLVGCELESFSGLNIRKLKGEDAYEIIEEDQRRSAIYVRMLAVGHATISFKACE
jgi:hypothetical protein